ncbi:DUF3526 domain-containing protein [uncultured Xylophilus sp.]|uniref:DUF3526 domain-containing protein n=1 Tax=uncultured Xylophilus sp. TaxID=296832 RepID=UPI0025F99C0B|nr:DUF3526 domain-containing protein [uncultured Xylophilus sp.]
MQRRPSAAAQTTRIAAATLRGWWRDGRAAVLALSMLVLLAAVSAAALIDYRAAAEERDSVAARTRAQWDTQGDRHPHRGAHFGLYVFRADTPLAALEPGITPQVGRTLWLEPHRRNLPQAPASADAPAGRDLAPTALVPMLVLLLPLLTIALGHDLVGRERAQGTLAMLQAAGVPARTLLVGQWAALCIALLAVLAPAAAVLLAGLARVEAPAGSLPRAAALCGTVVLYGMFWAALVVAVSARLRSVRGALLALLGLWTAAVLVLPRAGAALAAATVPLPTATAFWQAMEHDIRHGLPGDGDAAQRQRAFDADLLRTHGVARLEDLPFGASALRRLDRDAYAARVHALHFDRLWRAFGRQQTVLRAAGLATPALPARSAAMALAGTDIAHQRRFEDAAEAYRQDFTAALDAWDVRASRGLSSFESRYAGDTLWRSVPAFADAVPPAGFALRHAAPDLAVLAAWCALSVAALLWAARGLRP